MVDRYDYAAMSPETVQKAADDGLGEADRLVDEVVNVQGDRTFDNTLVPIMAASDAVWRADGRGAFIGQVHPDAAVRDAATEAEQRTQKWRQALPKRDDLAAAVRAYAGTPEAQGLGGSRRRSLDLMLRDLRRAGHDLDPRARAELAELDDRMIELAAAFGHNLGEWTDEIELEADYLAGLSPDFVARLPEGPQPGSRRLSITYSVVWPFLEQSERRDLRELALRRYLSRAAEVNRPVLDELLELRRRAARLLGAPSWSQFANEARMSGGADAVQAFLDRIFDPLQALAEGERAAMRAQLLAEGIDDDVQAWDWPYLHERQRRALGLDSAEVSAHFPLEASLTGLFDVLHEVFGVVVREEAEHRVWHPDVRLFVLTDATTGEHLADVYLDLYARDGKRPGAWQVALDFAGNLAGRPRRPAVISLVTNFTPPLEGRPALLQHDDVETLFHEFGHVLEFGLTRAKGFTVGESWVELDFVEAPSQIMEHWTWAPEVLRRFARHHATGQPPSETLLERLVATRNLNPGINGLWLFGWRTVLDQLLHGPEPFDSADAYRRAFAVTGFPFPEGTYAPSSFAHIAGIYDAGFYGYLWARAFGDDMFSAFDGEDLLSPEVGRRYRKEVLEPSWSVSGTDRVRSFLGREPSEAAFLQRLGIKGAVATSRPSDQGLPDRRLVRPRDGPG